MYVSLTYSFKIVQHTVSHIVEHRKLDSLATPDNIVTSLWRHCDVMLDQQCSSIWPQPKDQSKESLGSYIVSLKTLDELVGKIESKRTNFFEFSK